MLRLTFSFSLNVGLTEEEKEELRDVLVLDVNVGSKEFMKRMLIHKMYWQKEAQQMHALNSTVGSRTDPTNGTAGDTEDYIESPLYYIKSKHFSNMVKEGEGKFELPTKKKGQRLEILIG